MPTFFADRLEPLPVPGIPDATRGTVHDPVWFLTRQWQLGEFQGENASTPVKVEAVTTARAIVHTDSGQALQVVPPEVLVESEIDDWWTIGRRLRLGAVIAAHLGLEVEPRWVIADPPPPYDLVDPAWDGLEMWKGGLDVAPGVLPEIPPDPQPTWVEDELIYDRDDAFTADGVRLHLRRHRGGRLDWYSVDADVPADLPPAEPDGILRRVVPARLEYPGMPRRGVWEIEDAQADLAAIAPDAVHTATQIMLALYASHRDEWFDVPVPTPTGRILRIVRFAVTDSFGDVYVAERGPEGVVSGPHGLHPPVDAVPVPDSWLAGGALPWGLFHTRHLESGDLVLVQTVDRPLAGEVVERVQFGVDDESNLVWAVERRLDGRATTPMSPVDGTSLVPPRPSDQTKGQAYDYVPGVGTESHWIPYTMSETGQPRELVQRRLVDLSRFPVVVVGVAKAAVLTGERRRLVESVIPLGGLEVERRWMLVRDAVGEPHLWIQRQRRPLTSPPARTLRFDVAAPTDPA